MTDDKVLKDFDRSIRFGFAEQDEKPLSKLDPNLEDGSERLDEQLTDPDRQPVLLSSKLFRTGIGRRRK